MTPAERIVQLPGVRLSYVDQGRSDAPVVVLLHGFTDSWVSFTPLLERLPPTVRALAPSQRGHGNSGKPPTGYRTQDFAGDVLALLDALAIRRAVLVGHSSQGLVALRLALDAPDRVAGLMVIGGFATLHGETALERFVLSKIVPLQDPIPLAFVREFQIGTVSTPLPPAFVDAVVAESLKVPARVWKECFTNLLREDLSHDLSRVVAPTLLIRGERDPIVASDRQLALLHGVPRARLVAYKGVGHCPHWEQPERFANDLLGFVEGLPEAGK